jgi:hypothetical protein
VLCTIADMRPTPLLHSALLRRTSFGSLTSSLVGGGVEVLGTRATGQQSKSAIPSRSRSVGGDEYREDELAGGGEMICSRS